VRTLHETPILPKDVIELAGEKPYLAGSDLAEAAQRVRFTPTVMDVDETSKLWGMLHQTPYALSVVYQAALVFIDGRETPVPRKPVERTDVRVLPFGAPGAPVPPGVERSDDEASDPVPATEDAKDEAPAVAKKTEKPVAKKAAKAVAKTSARTRRTTTRTPRPARPGPRNSDGTGENTEK
ncbi:Pvc16 family protein, partial [Streptomyces sp. KR55]|uniref:Pvc16 family protein n=1 Tax=Streptomyces sp. KR55 TaxID=3457425 RepID=UPI003FD5417B